MCVRNLPDMYALSAQACGPRAYISGKSPMPMLQLTKQWLIWYITTFHFQLTLELVLLW